MRRWGTGEGILLDRSRTRVACRRQALEATGARRCTPSRPATTRSGSPSTTPYRHRVRDPAVLPPRSAHHAPIRICSAVVMLPLDQPLVVAQQFLVLDALHPGRVDLGLAESSASRRRCAAPSGVTMRMATFEDDLVELRGYLEGTAEVRLVPQRHAGADGPARHPAGVGLAAGWACPWSWWPLLESELADALSCYRRGFRPDRGSEPGDGLPGRARRRRRATGREPPCGRRGRWHATSDRRVPAARGIEAIREESWPSQVRRRVGPRSTGPWPAARDRPAPPRRAGGGDRRRRAAGEQLHPDRDALLASDRMLAELLR